MGKRIWSALLAAALVLGGTVPCGTVRAEAAVSDYLTEFIPQIREETVLTEQIAFTHPGIGMTKDMLDHMRAGSGAPAAGAVGSYIAPPFLGKTGKTLHLGISRGGPIPEVVFPFPGGGK